MTTISRRRFLQAVSAIGLTQFLPASENAQVTPPLPESPAYVPSPRPEGLGGPKHGAYTFLTRAEARFVEAAVARLVPADDLGPGALEAGVPYFIDQQLQGKFGLAAKWYMQGPWPEGTEQQGYQLKLTPQEVYRVCIPAIDMHAEENEGGLFADLDPARQDAVLTALENGELSIEPLPDGLLSNFWQILLDNTMQGYFADPAYGGNQDKVGWRLVGFPGVAAAYRNVMEAYYGRRYLVEPVSIADIHSGEIETDGNGHAVHRDVRTGEVVDEVLADHGGTNHGH